jgi:hypothetical protein
MGCEGNLHDKAKKGGGDPPHTEAEAEAEGGGDKEVNR